MCAKLFEREIVTEHTLFYCNANLALSKKDHVIIERRRYILVLEGMGHDEGRSHPIGRSGTWDARPQSAELDESLSLPQLPCVWFSC